MVKYRWTDRSLVLTTTLRRRDVDLAFRIKLRILATPAFMRCRISPPRLFRILASSACHFWLYLHFDFWSNLEAQLDCQFFVEFLRAPISRKESGTFVPPSLITRTELSKTKFFLKFFTSFHPPVKMIGWSPSSRYDVTTE